ncbi:MAG: hypothetical protein K5673_05520 [Lachnospiraceae bacterium]|nr:hypothetical protein [Lachnospiraceae bacterium]
MLTVKAPIEIKAKTTYMSTPEAFYRRITGNYSLMETPVTAEDLLHLSTTPPEIYVQEGEGMTSILTSNTRNETNLQKVEILNNVLNRIVLSADAHVTYQDRVFITDALYKLGIRDDRRFMKAFYRMAEETRNTNTLINLYLEKGMELREMLESMETEIRTQRTEESTETSTEKENYLYERIMDRLRTGAIYQIVSNFNRSVEETGIERNEYSIADQSYTAQHILLSMLRERAGIADENLVYLSTNTYEESLETTDVAVSQVRNEMNGAVLMDMLQNLYHTAFDRFYLNQGQYYRFEDVFFGASLSTLQRLTQYQGDVSLAMLESEQMLTENNYLTSSEIELLSGDSEGRVSEEELIRITQTVNEMNVRNEQRRQEYTRMLERFRRRARAEAGEGGLKQTLKDGRLALMSPGELERKLSAEEEVRAGREREILREMALIFPEEAVRIYDVLNQYEENPLAVLQSDILRPADEGELIYDIRQTEIEIEEAAQERARQAASDAAELMESIERARASEPVRSRQQAPRYEAIPTIHKRTESLSQEELEEQLDLMHQDLTRQIRNETVHETETQINTTRQSTVINNTETVRNIDERQIRRMIDEGVKSQVSAISNQVFRKLETQMRNEKIRRGY